MHCQRQSAQNNLLTLAKDQYWGGKRSTFFKSVHLMLTWVNIQGYWNDGCLTAQLCPFLPLMGESTSFCATHKQLDVTSSALLMCAGVCTHVIACGYPFVPTFWNICMPQRSISCNRLQVWILMDVVLKNIKIVSICQHNGGNLFGHFSEAESDLNHGSSNRYCRGSVN